ncbi:MAG: hypothetical protein GY712_05775 [Oceanicoccus sp.]|uniref:hypothetical protein n=1 Tax=Oceanicoccus sp. TaxID=2691044 RepID=UPI00260E9B7B|nr:hypothetical protein [Oceanicoccus sp.]MCP3907509.1 hypothetical protein [Oceanicoccus sp.]
MDSSSNIQVVRWPFRVLAMLFLFATLFVFLTTSYLGFFGGNLKMALIAIVILPLVALLGRLVGQIAIRGHVPSSPFWPFATGAVAFVWVVLFLVVVLIHV